MRVFVLAGAFCCSALTTQARNCYVPNFRVVDNQTGHGHMIVKSGARCSIARLSSTGPVTATRIVSRPMYGVASTRGAHIFYASRRGYVGPDRFTFQGSGQDRWGRSMVRTVNVHVQVVP